MHNVCLEKWQFDLIIEALTVINEKKCSKQVVATIDDIKKQTFPRKRVKDEQIDPFSTVGNDPINW
ncbi:MAG TPA: hypothetical protein EYQ21_06930 [Flavobacteriales bacterium]|jgi:hypothetical protein|nr:hypothetical protein [Flavobacteriales bacterium]